MAEKITSKLEAWNVKPSVAIKWNAISVLWNQWENDWKIMSVVNAIYTALFPSKGALPSLSTDCSLTQCMLDNKSHSKMEIKEIVLMKTLQPNGNNRNRVNGTTLNYFIEDKNNTTLGDLHSSIWSMLCLFPCFSNIESLISHFPTLWQWMASLYIVFPISGNRGISFHNVFDLWQSWHLFP